LSRSLFRYALPKIKRDFGEESRLDLRHTWAKSSAHYTGSSFAVRTVHQWVADTTAFNDGDMWPCMPARARARFFKQGGGAS